MCPPTATSGAHGLAAIARTAFGRALTTAGSVGTPWGTAGGPAGLPIMAGSSLKSNFGFAFTATAEPDDSGAPASIHALMTARSASGSLGCIGGIFGSPAWLTSS